MSDQQARDHALEQQIAGMTFLDDRQRELLKQSVLTAGEFADLFKVERNTAKRIVGRLELEVFPNTANKKSWVVAIDEKLLEALKHARPTKYRSRNGNPAKQYKRGNLAG